ncbi:response regulator [Desulfobacterium sp. N47]|uniref:response regulator n=1 Tax=Desulfobacterium sp. N47 TaxID=3115210 RepID=UPI003CB7BE7F
MNADRNQINYRNHMADSTFPAIPYYPVLINKELEANTSQSKAPICKQIIKSKELPSNNKKLDEIADLGETLLVVDDNKTITGLCKIFLENMGYKVLTSNMPFDAIRLVKVYDGKIQLLITDIRMPQINGLELAKQLTSIRPDMKCIYMSGDSIELYSDQNMLNKEVNFLQKPFTLHHLAERVRNVLNHYNAKIYL